MTEAAKDMFGRIHARFSRVVRFVSSGAVGAAIDLGLLFLFVRVMDAWYLPSAVVAFVLSYAVSFILQKFWTFRERSMERAHVQASSYLLLALANLVLNTLLMYALVTGIGLEYLAAQIIASAIIAVESYAFYKLIFKVPVA
ncbi:MAG: GtrA family protein [Patescibacteria group bacterium]|nr:GtrA family protein [Patescibacteria group bacterium]